ncbi:DUF2946 domain-containing protein [Stutzerimonas zhaodongensis]|uniref:DUF2946 domain-containing protein n=1 Tax=Stutzerimonas zhaodongensis TaxID=1176257 RepID=UPI002102E077|nr:DUF2946 domain-containing protein [Stutzerimonas zhaodongensis]MCQ2028770.1 DUF2946 domain-containing protein [Stutzerimonas zhaodongensis]
MAPDTEDLALASEPPMHRQRRAPIWIAAFAVLLHLVSMPLMAAHMRAMAVAGGHCTMEEVGRHHATHAHSHSSEPAPTQGHHQGMPCCCAAGSASLAAIPIGSPILHHPRVIALGSLPPATAPPLSPRYRWPSLNPRASPLA